jgi:hypothetical protein
MADTDPPLLNYQSPTTPAWRPRWGWPVALLFTFALAAALLLLA